MTVARKEEKLKLCKGSAFEESRLKRLRQKDETWEADFRALPKPLSENETHYLGWSSFRAKAPSSPKNRSSTRPMSTTWPTCWPMPCAGP